MTISINWFMIFYTLTQSAGDVDRCSSIFYDEFEFLMKEFVVIKSLHYSDVPKHNLLIQQASNNNLSLRKLTPLGLFIYVDRTRR